LAACATAGALALGLPAAFALARCVLPGRETMRLILLSPLIFPVLVIGVALLRLFSDWNSNSAPVNLLIGHVLVTTPYVVRTVTASLLLADISLEEAARTLGAGRWRVLRRVTLPQIASGVAAGALFAFMVSFDNYPISMWLADAQNVPMPMLIYRRVASMFTPAVPAMSTLMILFAFAVVLVMERLAGLRRAMAM
jgi:putative spermidine/putrescine transport system permease protein